MTGLIDWASARARMILAFVVLSLIAGFTAYQTLPKSGEPDIQIPVLFISVPFPGISAEDSEKLLVRPVEQRMTELEGLKSMSATASEGYAGIALEFEFGWDKAATIAEVRSLMDEAEAEFPDGAETYSVNELNFAEIPIMVVALSGDVPERQLIRRAKELQDEIEAMTSVLEAGLAGARDELVEVIIDPLRLEAYDVAADELVRAVQNNNQLVNAGEIELDQGAFAIKIPSSFDEPSDVYSVPVKSVGDRVVVLGDIAEIRLTFEDRVGTARYNGDPTIALQVVKRKGFNVIETADQVEANARALIASWPEEVQEAIDVTFTMDTSSEVESMVSQLEASVLTAIALVMIVVLAALGPRSALLVGFAIPTAFLLSFVTMAVLGMEVSNIVMFGLILAVGMLVDGAIVIVEYADRRISEGQGPMRAYTEAAKRMFWPIVSSTATTLCAFMPMLFWPGVPGEFMGNLPVTLIFVLSAALLVSLVYLPVIGGVTGRMVRWNAEMQAALRMRPLGARALYAVCAVGVLVLGALAMVQGLLPVALLLITAGLVAVSVTVGALRPAPRPAPPQKTYRRSLFGHAMHGIVGNPVGPFLAIAAVIGFVMFTFSYFGSNNNGVEFFVDTEPERSVAYVRARGNLSLSEKDAMVRAVEDRILGIEGVESVFAFAGEGGLTQGPGASSPLDTVGQIQIEFTDWTGRLTREDPLTGDEIIEALNLAVADLPGVEVEVTEQAQGPAQGKPIHLRLKGDNLLELQQIARLARAHFEAMPGLTDIDDTTPLPGIDWQIDVDVAAAGRDGANVAIVGEMVKLVTRGIMLDTMRVDTSDEEIDIRVRLPEDDRVLATLDTLRVRTANGLVPLSNFVTRTPVQKLAQIDREDGTRYYDVRADVGEDLVVLTRPIEGEEDATEVVDVIPAAEAETDAGKARIAEDGLTVIALTANERIERLTAWLDSGVLPEGVSYEWTGDQEEQAESMAFLGQAFLAALGLMFVILLAQFNSLYNSVLVLLAVVLSTTGALWGMIAMGQPFSIIMTGTGIVALAGIVVNNNIVLIDTYQELRNYMPRLEAIVRTAEMRIRPVLLTTITTMAGLAPMMLGLSVDFVNGGATWGAPTALWWIQLATAVVWGLGIATVLTLVVTPAMLAARIWFVRGLVALWSLRAGEGSPTRRDRQLRRDARAAWGDVEWEAPSPPTIFPKAAE